MPFTFNNDIPGFVLIIKTNNLDKSQLEHIIQIVLLLLRIYQLEIAIAVLVEVEHSVFICGYLFNVAGKKKWPFLIMSIDVQVLDSILEITMPGNLAKIFSFLLNLLLYQIIIYIVKFFKN